MHNEHDCIIFSFFFRCAFCICVYLFCTLSWMIYNIANHSYSLHFSMVRFRSICKRCEYEYSVFIQYYCWWICVLFFIYIFLFSQFIAFSSLVFFISSWFGSFLSLFFPIYYIYIDLHLVIPFSLFLLHYARYYAESNRAAFI